MTNTQIAPLRRPMNILRGKKRFILLTGSIIMLALSMMLSTVPVLAGGDCVLYAPSNANPDTSFEVTWSVTGWSSHYNVQSRLYYRYSTGGGWTYCAGSLRNGNSNPTFSHWVSGQYGGRYIYFRVEVKSQALGEIVDWCEDSTYISLSEFSKAPISGWNTIGWEESNDGAWSTYEGEPLSPPYNNWGVAASGDPIHYSKARINADSSPITSGYSITQSGYYDIKAKWYLHGNIWDIWEAQHLRLKVYIKYNSGSGWQTAPNSIMEIYYRQTVNGYVYLRAYDVPLPKNANFRIYCETEALANQVLYWHGVDYCNDAYYIQLVQVYFGDNVG